MTTQDRQIALAQALNASQMQQKVAMEQAEEMAIRKLREDRAAEIKEENALLRLVIDLEFMEMDRGRMN